MLRVLRWDVLCVRLIVFFSSTRCPSRIERLRLRVELVFFMDVNSVFFCHQVSEAECEGALEETRWDVCCVCLIVCFSSTRCQRRSARGRWRRRGGTCVACV